jgi:hypothetical protein
MNKSIAIAVICGWATSFAADQTALAQAGSVGGTIGKTDKSVSGSATDEQNTRKPKAKPRNSVSRPEAKAPKACQNPTINGIRVDHCLDPDAHDCDATAATAWCRSKGMSHAVSFNWEPKSPAMLLTRSFRMQRTLVWGVHRGRLRIDEFWPPDPIPRTMRGSFGPVGIGQVVITSVVLCLPLRTTVQAC